MYLVLLLVIKSWQAEAAEARVFRDTRARRDGIYGGGWGERTVSCNERAYIGRADQY